MSKEILTFKTCFEKEWNKCLLDIDFNEINAKQLFLGNRLRPILFFMGFSFGEIKITNFKACIPAARLSCSLELIHKASVMFDDFIDKDDFRNGEEAFHKQYESINKMVLLGSTMLGQAGMNWTQNLDDFKCETIDAFNCTFQLFEIIKRLCTGCYKELGLPSYVEQDERMVNDVTYNETVFLIKSSLLLGYIAGHRGLNKEERRDIEQLGEDFGYIFQWLNDLEAYSKKSLYEKHKGKESMHFDYGRKNIAFLALYKASNFDEKGKIDNGLITYSEVIDLYQKYRTEDYILNKVNQKIEHIKYILEGLMEKDKKWVSTFQWLFDLALEKKEWIGQVNSIHF